MADLFILLSLVIGGILILVFTGSLVRDLVKGEPFFSSLRKWAVRVLDTVFSIN